MRKAFLWVVGNTFVLMNKMYELNLLEKLKSAILSGVPYLEPVQEVIYVV